MQPIQMVLQEPSPDLSLAQSPILLLAETSKSLNDSLGKNNACISKSDMRHEDPGPEDERDLTRR